MDIIVIILLIALAVQYLYYLSVRKERGQLKEELYRKNEEFKSYKKEFTSYQQEMEPLKKYITVMDAEAEAERIKIEAKNIMENAQHDYDSKISEAKNLADSELGESRAKAKEIREKAEKQLQDAKEIANKLEKDAQKKAMEIAGEAWKAKENAIQYEATVRAMKNIIAGYGDEYLIPNKSLLDTLAEEYDFKEVGQKLANIRTLIKSMIKNKEAAECDYVEPYRRDTAIEFVLDAFNGKVDTIMAKAKHDNYGVLKQQLEDAFRLVNHNGKAFRNARIIPRYFDVMMEQLSLAVAVQELKRIDQEEQRRIKEQIREEERAQREFEKAQMSAEKEEKMLKNAMRVAENKLMAAAEAERAQYEEQLDQLRKQLAEAEERGQRAMSMAQQTKRGHVYVISNIGSFGEEIFKIGLTRRLEPLERIKELGDSSVPFEFDVHTLIYSEDAPGLEHSLHQKFEKNQVNKVNPRKEFFRLPIHEIKNQVSILGIETHWTLKAEAREYRESLQVEKTMNAAKP